MTHSPEPWHRGEENESYALLVDATSSRVARVFNQYGVAIPGNAKQIPGDTNVERIVACINFCREFKTEWLKDRTLRYITPEMEIRTAGDIEKFDGFMAVQLVPVCVNDDKQA